MKPAHTWGTDIRRSIDVGALGQAIARPGTDLRYWVSHGTICTVDEKTGRINTENPNAIWIGPEGVECDVRLEPLNMHVCCRYAGISAGDVTIYPPIRPGDLVLVNLPEGLPHLPVIVAILHSGGDKQPLDAETHAPIFDNKRLLVYAKTAAIDVRNAGGVQVLIEQNGTVTTTAKKIKQGSASASQHAVLGDEYTTQWQTLLAGMQTYIGAIQSIADPTWFATTAMARVLSKLQARAFLSSKVTLE